MEALGEELYAIIVQCYPELAPKLTGMLLSLGEEECVACLESQERLAERLDEAFAILDSNGQCATEPPPEERRIDPEDGKARTFKELRSLCASRYSMEEIEEYWGTMVPEAGTSAAAPKAKAKAKAAGTAASANSGSTAPRTAASAASSARPAAGTGAAAAAAPAPSAEPDEALPGLTCWLRELKLTSYATAATKWIEEQGACNLEEVVENLEDFAESLSLKKLEQKRLMQNGEAAAKAAMEAAASAEPAPAAEEAKPSKPGTSPEAARHDRELEAARQEQEEFEREMEELRAMQEEAEAIGTRPRGAPAAKSTAASKPKAPSVRVAPKAKAPAPTREEIEWNCENEREEREFQKKQQARQAAREAEEAAQATEEKRLARAREAEERQQRAAAELAAKVGSAAPGGGEAAAEDFPALGAGDWQAASAGKKGRKKR